MRRTHLVIPAAFLSLLVAGLVTTHMVRAALGGSGAEAATEHARPARPLSAIAVLTAVAASRDVPITEASVGWVEPIASVAVRARIDGVIVTQAVTDGQTVKAGDLLFHLDDQAIQAMLAKDRATLARDQANAEQLQADLERLQTLHKTNDATEQQVEQQQAALDQERASIAADQAQIQSDQVDLDYTVITAPIAGRVGVINETLGNLVHVGDADPLLTITQMAPLRVSFTVPERDLGAFRQALVAKPPAVVRALDPESGAILSSGVLNFIDSTVDTSSGTVMVKANFDNADGVLWPGEYVRVEADLGVHSDATVVPVVAVQLNETGSFVFLVKPDGTVAGQTVTVADESGDNAVIGSGLHPGDHVVVEGQLRLQDGSRVAETVAAAGDAGRDAPTAPPKAIP